MAVTSVHPTRPDTAAWRKAIGRRLRTAREAAGLRLVDVARLARVSPQYLSEVERGRKEASSEVLAAVTGALGMTLVDLAGGVARDLTGALPTGTRTLSSIGAGVRGAGASTPPYPGTGAVLPGGRHAEVVSIAGRSGLSVARAPGVVARIAA